MVGTVQQDCETTCVAHIRNDIGANVSGHVGLDIHHSDAGFQGCHVLQPNSSANHSQNRAEVLSQVIPGDEMTASLNWWTFAASRYRLPATTLCQLTGRFKGVLRNALLKPLSPEKSLGKLKTSSKASYV